MQGFPGGTQGRKELDMTEVTQCTHTYTHRHTHTSYQDSNVYSLLICRKGSLNLVF